MDLGERILDAQLALNTALAAQTEATDKIRQLEQQIVQLKSWVTERERYEPVNIYLGTIAYMPKIGMENGEPPHWLCANCFQRHTKSFLSHKGQTQTANGGRGQESKWGCDECKASMMVSYRCHPNSVQEKRLNPA